MSDGIKLFEHLNFLVVVTKSGQLEATRSIVDLLKENSCQICSVYKSFDVKGSTVPEDVKHWFINDVTEGNTIHFIVSEDANFPFYNVASTDLLIPVVTSSWIHNCIEAQKHVRTSSFSPNPRHIFKDFQIYVSRHSFNHSEYLFYTETVHALGGTCVDFLSNKTTHLVTKDPHDPGILAVINFGTVEPMQFVYPTWVVQSFKQMSTAPEDSHKISPDDSDYSSKSKLEDLWSRLNEIDFKLNSKVWENHSFIIGMDVSLNRHLYSTVIEFLQANGGAVHRHLDESDIMKTKADCYIGKSTSSSEYEAAENKRLHLGNLIWIFYMWSLGNFTPPTEKLIFSPFKRKLLETNQLISTYTNFFGQQRFYIQRLVNALGGFTTSELSRRNTHLLCRFPFGKKYETARKWNDKCVVTNHLWLEECYKHSTRLDPLESRFQQLPVEGGLSNTLGQMQWDTSPSDESHVKNLEKKFNEEERNIQDTPLPSQDNEKVNETNDLQKQIPELQPIELKSNEERRDTNGIIQSDRANLREKEEIEKDSGEPKFMSQGDDGFVDRGPNVQSLCGEENVHQELSREEPVPPFDSKGEATHSISNREAEPVNSTNKTEDNDVVQEVQPTPGNTVNGGEVLIENVESDDLQKPQDENTSANGSQRKALENTQEKLQKDLEEIKNLQGETEMNEQSQKPENYKQSIQNENTENEEQKQQFQEMSIKQYENFVEHEPPRKTHAVTAQGDKQNKDEYQYPNEKSKEFNDEQQSPRKLQKETSTQRAPKFPIKHPISPRSASENASQKVATTERIISSEFPKATPEVTVAEHIRDESKTPLRYNEDPSKSQTPPSSLMSTPSDPMHSSQVSRRMAKEKAARKLHNDIESLNEFQRNSKRKKTGNLLPEEIAQLEKKKSLEVEAKKILSKVLSEEHEIVKHDTESDIKQQQQGQHRHSRRLPYSINAITTGLADDIGELDLTILRLIGINIHKDITAENFSNLDGVIAPKRLRTAKFLKSLSFHPLRYALTPKILKDILKIVHKGKKASLTLDLSRYYIPDTDHDKLVKLTLLSNKIFERVGISKVNITIDIPGGVDTISSILKAHGVRDTKAIPTAHMNKLSIQDFLLNNSHSESTENTSSDYIFLVNKPTQVRFFKKLTKDSGRSALAVSWDWFVTSIFQLEVNVNNSDHVIYRSG